MAPTLRDGDWLLVDPAPAVPVAGDLVVADDPRRPGRWLVKRVVGVGEESGFRIAGDHPAHAGEAEAMGDVPVRSIVGRPWFRYWPPGCIGPLRARGASNRR